MLQEAAGEGTQPTDLLVEEALALLAERLATPLQIEKYLTLIFEEAYRIGQKPVTVDTVETILAVGLDDLEPHLVRHGYSAPVLAQLLNVRPTEVKSFLAGQLSPGHTQELRERMLKMGVPL